MPEYIATSDVKLYKSPGYLFRDTLKQGSKIVSTESSGGWLKLDTPLQYAGYWGETKYFDLYSTPEPPPPPPVGGDSIVFPPTALQLKTPDGAIFQNVNEVTFTRADG